MSISTRAEHIGSFLRPAELLEERRQPNPIMNVCGYWKMRTSSVYCRVKKSSAFRFLLMGKRVAELHERFYRCG